MSGNNKLNDALNEMVEIVTSVGIRRVTFEDVSKLAGSLTNEKFYNEISLDIAQKYQDGLLSYGVSSEIMNNLWGAVVEATSGSELDIPQPFYEIYEAFDAGEYHRAKDQSDNPVADYTDPMIREILSRIS